MEAELLTVLGHIPAPDDRDVPTQLENIERSRVIRTIYFIFTLWVLYVYI